MINYNIAQAPRVCLVKRTCVVLSSPIGETWRAKIISGLLGCSAATSAAMSIHRDPIGRRTATCNWSAPGRQAGPPAGQRRHQQGAQVVSVGGLALLIYQLLMCVWPQSEWCNRSEMIAKPLGSRQSEPTWTTTTRNNWRRPANLMSCWPVWPGHFAY